VSIRITARILKIHEPLYSLYKRIASKHCVVGGIWWKSPPLSFALAWDISLVYFYERGWLFNVWKGTWTFEQRTLWQL